LSAIDRVSGAVVDECIRIHRELGPGLLESVYEAVLAAALARRGFKIDRQMPVDINYDGLCLPAAFKIDLLIENALILEIKSVERLSNLHAKQLLTYLRLTGLHVGLLLNFSGETMKEASGASSTTTGADPSAPPRLRERKKNSVPA
jgi:iron complex transport system substrate-binding protein